MKPAPGWSMPVLLERRTAARATTVTLAGELDITAAPTLRRVFSSLLSPALPILVVDLRRVLFLDCSVLGVFVLTQREAASLGGSMRLVGAQRLPLRLIRMSGLDAVLDLHETLSSATRPTAE
jgi:anti-sigma B factor antagonist